MRDSTLSRSSLVTNMSRWRCVPCDVNFTSRRALKRHEIGSRTHLTHTNANPNFGARHECSACSKSFVRLHDLRRHTSEQHGDGKKPCPICSKVIRPGAPHRCPADGDSAGEENMSSPLHSSSNQYSRDNIALTYIDHSIGDVDEYLCNCCGVPFADLSGKVISQHFRRHLNGMIAGWECRHCEMLFQHSYDLSLHNSWVERYGQCGFDFEHQIQCTGHHPLTALTDESSRERIQDRQSFCARLRSWEYEQFHVYRKTMEAFAAQQILHDSVASRELPGHDKQDDELLGNGGSDCPGQTCTQGETSSRVQQSPSEISLFKGLTVPLAWEGVKHVFDFNEDHLYSPDWNCSDKNLCKQFLSLMRNLVELQVDQEQILNTLEAVASDPGKVGRLFEWQQITIVRNDEGIILVADEFALILLEDLCRDLGCG